MKLAFNHKLPINHLKEIVDIVAFLTKGHLIDDNIMFEYTVKMSESVYNRHKEQRD